MQALQGKSMPRKQKIKVIALNRRCWDNKTKTGEIFEDFLRF
jgi:hypothetical protein